MAIDGKYRQNQPDKWRLEPARQPQTFEAEYTVERLPKAEDTVASAVANDRVRVKEAFGKASVGGYAELASPAGQCIKRGSIVDTYV